MKPPEWYCADPGCYPVSSFLSTWSHSPLNHSRNPSAEHNNLPPASADASVPLNSKTPSDSATTVTSSSQTLYDLPSHQSPSPTRARATSGSSRPSSRPASMVQTYQPPLMEVANDTPPELQPVFTFLNSHSNKLYQEGYFLKLHDLDSRGRPSSDRTWQECFAV